MSQVNKNATLIKEELINQMNIGLDNVNRLIGKMFGTGPTGWALNPIAKLIYKIMLSNDIRTKTKNQINIILECANLYKPNGNGHSDHNQNSNNGSNLQDIVNKYFDDYRLNDQSFHHCKKDHKAYPEIEQMMKEVFKSRIEPANQLLISEGETYSELTRNAFTKKDALDNVNREFEATAEMLELLKENLDVMDVPSFCRRRIVNIMVKAFEITKQQIYGRIDEIFNGFC